MIFRYKEELCYCTYFRQIFVCGSVVWRPFRTWIPRHAFPSPGFTQGEFLGMYNVLLVTGSFSLGIKVKCVRGLARKRLHIVGEAEHWSMRNVS